MNFRLKRHSQAWSLILLVPAVGRQTQEVLGEFCQPGLQRELVTGKPEKPCSKQKKKKHTNKQKLNRFRVYINIGEYISEG